MATTLMTMEDLEHRYGGVDGHLALKDLAFEVREGEFLTIVGPSGCGKTTLLRCSSGLLRPTSGRVLLGGRPVDGVPDELALVFQDYSRSLFPWMTVRKNVRFPLTHAGLDRHETRERVEESIDAVGLSDFGDYYPWQLSGGMQQRVAIARCLAYRPRILFMDEPFASVDAQTRSDLEDLILTVHARFGMTTLFVTHDIDESIYLADRVLVLSSAPAHVLADIPVDLPHPRDQIDTKRQHRFVQLRAEVAQMIRRASRRGESDVVREG